jgi:DNA primase
LRDAVDLFERKIQLLERHGWFEGVEHRRDAVDRLLPTIRAAADPITRELYLSLAAKRAGVSKEVLERELIEGKAAGQRGSAAGVAAERSQSTGSRSPGRARNNPETQLLQVMLWSPEWLERARTEIAPVLFRSVRNRELFEALLRAGSEAGGQLPSDLSDEAAGAWSRLKEAAQALNTQEVGKIYDQAVQILLARPQYREMDALTDPGEKRRRRVELRTQFPAADAWYEYQKAAFKEIRNQARGTRGA